MLGLNVTKDNKSKPLKILKGERITIPKEFMKELELKIGDWILINCDGQELKIIPAEVIPRD